MKTAITGGIGSGKSYICNLLRKRGVDIYDCDNAAKRIMHSDDSVRQKLTELIGPQAYNPDGSPRKAEIARYLLESEAHAKAIDAIVHPAVADDFRRSGDRWMECALLYEAGFDRLVDRVVAIVAPEQLRVERIAARDHITPDEARQWIAKQWPQEEVARRADIVVRNDGRDLGQDIEDLLK